jgi:NAD(P)-dependent dehydrogenase (short-subunit alcohol dehydrogenase family)
MNTPGGSGRVSLVTGSVRGLGLATARALQARGDRVHVVYRSSADAARALESEFPGRVHRADALSEADLRQLVERVLARDERLDHLVHAVGEFVTGPLSELEPSDFRRMLASNAESSFLVHRAAREALRRSKGSLVFFGCAGLDGLRARREAAAYAAAKSALLVLARSLALEEGPHGVRVNLVSPGIVPHPHASTDTAVKARSARIPLGRPGEPQDIANAVLWLCSPQAAYVTGVDLEVAGGWML